MKAAVLWTGGKDSALALQVSLNLHHIRRLICFVPVEGRQFYAHPTELMELQAQKIGMPIEFVPISEPYKQSYRQQIEAIRDTGIKVLITGDISTVGGMPNWIEEVAEGLVAVHKPLWEFGSARDIGYPYRQQISGHLFPRLQKTLSNRQSPVDI